MGVDGRLVLADVKVLHNVLEDRLPGRPATLLQACQGLLHHLGILGMIADRRLRRAAALLLRAGRLFRRLFIGHDDRLSSRCCCHSRVRHRLVVVVVGVV